MPTPITTKPSSFASRLKSFGVVHAALTTHSGKAVHELAQRQAALAACRAADEPVLDATADTSTWEFLALLAGDLEGAKAGMVSANAAHLGQLALIVELKERRDSLTRNLFSRFSRTHRIFETLHGSDRRFPLLAISGDTPSDPTGLVAQVRDSVGFLEEPKVSTPALDLPGFEIDPRTVATELLADADELGGVLVEVNEAEKQADATREAKNAAISGYDRKFLRVAGVAESVFHYAGMHELATWVRPSTRRPGRRLADEGGATDALEAETGGLETEIQPVEAPAEAFRYFPISAMT